jgi:amidase
MAIGCDTGGSIRIPSAWCGVVGLKPTYGLVPYTGAFPTDITLDHIGPIARTTAGVARLLAAIAGYDGMDPRQHPGMVGEPYTEALTGDVRGVRIGMLEEGFGWPGTSEPVVDAAVRQAAQVFTQLGAHVETVSLPAHRDGIHIWTVIAVEGSTTLMVGGNGVGTNWKGRYLTDLLQHFGQARTSQAHNLSEIVKIGVLLGGYLQERYYGAYYARAQNLAQSLRATYEQAFATYDVLLLPTVPFKATRLPAPDVSRKEYVAQSLGTFPNTSPFNVTGHPAITVPCGMADGLPVGMMLVGRHGADALLLRAADAFERRQR